eukprot:2179991-Amphidinium_carterae.1
MEPRTNHSNNSHASCKATSLAAHEGKAKTSNFERNRIANKVFQGRDGKRSLTVIGLWREGEEI